MEESARKRLADIRDQLQMIGYCVVNKAVEWDEQTYMANLPSWVEGRRRALIQAIGLLDPKGLDEVDEAIFGLLCKYASPKLEVGAMAPEGVVEGLGACPGCGAKLEAVDGVCRACGRVPGIPETDPDFPGA